VAAELWAAAPGAQAVAGAAEAIPLADESVDAATARDSPRSGWFGRSRTPRSPTSRGGR